ncbi:methyl-accepting chemotaxis protein [Tepidibacter formicigenes]|jgi:methyl-accepting chemotaxis protein|uniref:Methyl-accepting chemotaxis protein n=1 Tax=Tepidibacter formicigenes DSM 15518 TaxID=1123349 RepID=A0A1M6JP27_9FIRM|nr:methyl-accepting chemotaxis protein [Tepidibacter formicigenes]SHJ48388.1 methyl-accepting chemotaxis protein [Tepidibacter formicigenes DSM 15518]
MTKFLKFKHGLISKLIIVFILLITIPLSTLGISTYLKSTSILENQLKDNSFEMVKQIKENVTTFIEENEYNIIQMSRDPNVQRILATPTAEPFMMKTFESFKYAHPSVQSIYLATNDGNMHIYPQVELPEGYDPTKKDWYKDTVSKNSILWANPYKDIATKKMITTIYIPVYNLLGANEFVGVLGIDISLDSFSNKVNRLKIGKNGYAVLIDENLNIITHKNKSLIGTHVDVKEIVAGIKKSREGTIEYKREEKGIIKEKIALFSKIDKLGWAVLVTIYTDEIKDDTKVLFNNTLFVGLVSVLVAIFIAIKFAKNLTKPINILLDSMKKAREGDFRVRCNLKNKDEIGYIGKGFNDMLDDIGTLINNVKRVSEELNLSAQNLAANAEETSASAEEVATTIRQISKGALEQASESETGVVLTSNLANKLNELSESTNDILDNVKEVNNANLSGAKIINELKEITKLNNENTKKAQEAIFELNNKAKNIVNILDTITSIAEQTNLLALNASIEAARAGEAGKGFAVVADEIRKLAESSSNAANEIKNITTDIQDESSKTVEIMNEVKESNVKQSNTVTHVNNSFDIIKNSIDKITEKIKTIGEYVYDINTDKESIVKSIESISSVSEETAAGAQEVSASMQQQASAVEEVANSSDMLSQLAMNLNEEIGKFKI